MRDKRFVTEIRGGYLTKEHHILLMIWACDCAEHILPLLGESKIESLDDALSIAHKWTKGLAKVSEARNAAIAVHKLANEYSIPVTKFVARSIGHTVATAHMAEHSIYSALYALKSIKACGKSLEEERNWQREHIPNGIKELVLSGLSAKEKGLKL